MEISPSEAEQALTTIREMTQKTRRAISDSGAYLFLIVWGVVWLVGFLGSQFLPGDTSAYVWMGIDILGGAISAVIGIRMGRRIRSTSPVGSGKRIGIFWFLLFLNTVAAVAVSWPVDGRQIAMLIILFVMTGWIAMALLLSFANLYVGLAVIALALLGYYLLPDWFYLWMAILGGGGMVAVGLYIRSRW